MIFFFSYSLQGQKKSSRVRRLHLYLCPPSHVPNPPSLFILTHTWAFVCVIHSRETDDSNLANRGPPLKQTVNVLLLLLLLYYTSC